MPAVVTDQFRIFNANNFVESLLNSSNSYYVFLGLSNPISVAPGFGRTTTANWPLNPLDNFQYLSHYRDTTLFGKKISSANVRRVVKKNTWVANTRYDMYRHDYSAINQSPNSQSTNLYGSNYYVVNSDLRVYICIDNGSSGAPGSDTAKGGNSLDEPTFTDTEPSAAGTSGDGYIWKYLYTISPSDIIKFDSTEFISLPNDWPTSTDNQIQTIREAGDSRINNNQIKKVYIDDSGSSVSSSYQEGETTVDILGDGSGGEVSITVDSNGKITKTTVTKGGQGYTYGVVDLGPIQTKSTINEVDRAKLIPIIPPSRGHGFDLYLELGADKILIYTRFDDSSPDFPTTTKFSQVGIIKNPEQFSNRSVFSGINFSSAFGLKLASNPATTPSVGDIISQGTAKGYVTSYNTSTNVLKYSRDRSLYFGNKNDQTDYVGVSSASEISIFSQTSGNVDPLGVGISAFSGSTVTLNNKVVGLGVTFTGGLANPEINKQTGDIIYIDNRALVTRDARQKEDVKIILEF